MKIMGDTLSGLSVEKKGPVLLTANLKTYALGGSRALIDTIPYQFEEGMTWHEWITSEYNTFSDTERGPYFYEEGEYVQQSAWLYSHSLCYGTLADGSIKIKTTDIMTVDGCYHGIGGV